MHYRTLGRTGIKVSPYCARRDDVRRSIGNPDHDDSIRIIHKALDAGINFIDTADVYSAASPRRSSARRSRAAATTSCSPPRLSRPMGDDPNQQGTSRRWIMTAVENSLRRLQTDHIDLYQIHRPDPDTDVEETLSALTDLIHSGKVRAIGSSTLPASDIVEAQWVAERRGLERFRTEQPHVLDPQPRHRARGAAGRTALRHGHAGVEPAGQGMLTGRVRKGQQADLAPRALHASSTSATSAGSTPSSSSSRSPTRRACR